MKKDIFYFSNNLYTSYIMMVSVTILTVLKSPRFIWLTLFMVAIFLGNVSQSNANDRRDKYNISNLTRHLSALQYNQNKKFFYAQNNIPPPSNQNSVPKATVAEKKVSTPPPHDHFAYSPARPFCENCFEHGVFSPRFRGGLQLFESTGDGDKSSSSSLLPPSVPYKGSTEPSRKPKWCKDVVIVQGDTRMPSLTAIGNDLLPKDYDYSTFADSIMGNGAQSVIDATFLINSAYAYLHDYGYVFLTINYFAIGYRGLEWGNVAILRHVAKVCPAATVLYLDSDAYIRDLASEIAVEKIKAYRHSNDAGLDKLVLPKYPGAVGPSTPFLLAAPIECQWMTWLNAQPQLNRCFNMQQHNSLFRTQGWSGDAHAGVLNTGVMMVPHIGKARPFLEKWWQWPEQQKDPKIRQYLIKWPVEQQILALLLEREVSLRDDILMMDPSMYSGPQGLFIRHHYGKVNRAIASRKNSDLHFTLCYVSRHLRAMNASTAWISNRQVTAFK